MISSSESFIVVFCGDGIVDRAGLRRLVGGALLAAVVRVVRDMVPRVEIVRVERAATEDLAIIQTPAFLTT
jgi:hypothetical protein